MTHNNCEPASSNNYDGLSDNTRRVPRFLSDQTCSLYVGDLHPDINELHLSEKFGSVANIESCRVCRDMISKESLGYAYVNFHQRADAEKAIEMFNFEELNGSQMRLMSSERNPSLRKSGIGNIFIRNLHTDITIRDLYDTISAFGIILSVKIAVDNDKCSKGYGFVHFQTEDEAKNAIRELHGMMIFGKKLFVCNFRPNSERKVDNKNLKFNNIFVKKFGKNMNDKKLRDIFSPFGDILSLKVELDDKNQSKGFGFVCYQNCESAVKAIEEMNGKELHGQKLYVGRAMKKNERSKIMMANVEEKKQPGVNLYVKNLSNNVTDDVLWNEFSSFGTIISAKVMTNSENGRSKGFGFVSFQSADEGATAMTEMNGKYVDSKPLYVAIAQGKDERRQHLTEQYTQVKINTTPHNQNQQNVSSSLPNQMNNPQWPFSLPTLTNGLRRSQSFSQQTMGQVPQMRPHIGGVNPVHAMNQLANRPTVSQMRTVNHDASMAANFYENKIPMNPNQQTSPSQGLPNPFAGVWPLFRENGNEERDKYFLQNLEFASGRVREEILGDILFRHVSKLAPPEWCPRVTGMIIAQNFDDVRNMLQLHLQNPMHSGLHYCVNTIMEMIVDQQKNENYGKNGGPNER